MVDETPETLRAEIDHYRRLAPFVTDARAKAEIEKMIQELEQRLRDLEERTAPGSLSPPRRRSFAALCSSQIFRSISTPVPALHNSPGIGRN